MGSSASRAASSTQGYWLAASDGGVFAFGDAPFYGSAENLSLNAPVVGIASTPTGRGYWLTAADGGVFDFGDAQFFGSLANARLNAPVVGIAVTPSGQGYRLVASDGGVFALGDASFASRFLIADPPKSYALEINEAVAKYASGIGVGRVVSVRPNQTPSGDPVYEFTVSLQVLLRGQLLQRFALVLPVERNIDDGLPEIDLGAYYLLYLRPTKDDSGRYMNPPMAFAYDQPGGTLGIKLVQAAPALRPGIGIAAPDGAGYWVASADGGVFAFGDAQFEGSLGGTHLNRPVIGIAALP